MSAEVPPFAAGGTGGKFPKRPRFHHARSTPYARPCGTPRRWLPKVLDPALKLFSSVFRGDRPRGIESSRPRETAHETIEVANDSILTNNLTPEEPQKGDEDGQTMKDDGDGISKLEHIVKQKTFTRNEFDKLIILLRSRTIDLSSGNEIIKPEPSTSKPVDKINGVDDTRLMAQGSEMQNSRVFKSSLKRGTGLNASEVEIASPTEIAKAYMGSRPSTPSLQSPFHSSALRDISASPISSLFHPKTVDGSVASRPVIRFSKLVETGHLTPELQGSSSVHKLPESRFKGCSSISRMGIDQRAEAYAGPSRSQVDSPEVLLSASKLNLKRSSSVLDGDSGYVGPVCRIRLKSSLETPSKEVPFSPFGGCLRTASQIQGYTDSGREHLLLESARYKNTVIEEAEDGATIPSSSSFASVPHQSSLMARKILQQLDQLVPSPKEAHSEEVSCDRDWSQSKISLGKFKGGMLASRKLSPKDRDSTKKLNLEGSKKLAGLSSPYVKDPIVPTSFFQDKIESNGPVSLDIPGTSIASESNVTSGFSSSTLEVKPVGLILRQPILGSAVTPKSKSSESEQVSESSLELHADGGGSKATGSILAEKANHGYSIGESITISSQTILRKTPVVSISSTVSSKTNSNKLHEDNVFTFPVTTAQVSSEPHSILSVPNQAEPVEEQLITPVFNIGSKKARRLIFSQAVASGGNLSGLQFGIEPEWQSQIPTSMPLMHKGVEDAEEHPVFTFGSQSNTNLRNGVMRPIASALSFASRAPHSAGSVLGSDNSFVLSGLSSFIGPGTSVSASPSTSLLAGSSAASLLVNSIALSTVKTDLKDSRSSVKTDSKDLYGKPSQVSGSCSAPLAGFSPQAGSNFGLNPASSSTSFSFSTPIQSSSIFGLIPATTGTSLSSTSVLQPASEPTASMQSSLNQFSFSASATPAFGSTSTSIFAAPFLSAPSSTALPPTSSVFGKQPLASPSLGSDQMNVDRGQPLEAPAQSNLSFSSSIPETQSSIFKFESQQGQALSQTLTTSSSDLAVDGSFSLGSSSGADKSGRRIIKVKRDRSQKK